MITEVRDWLAADWRVVMVTEGHGPAQRLAEMLRGEGIGARLADPADPPESGVPYVTTARLENGFVWSSLRLVLLTESDLAGHPAGLATTKDMRRMPSGGAAASTRCSSSPATTWCTSSTASASTSR